MVLSVFGAFSKSSPTHLHERVTSDAQSGLCTCILTYCLVYNKRVLRRARACRGSVGKSLPM